MRVRVSVNTFWYRVPLLAVLGWVAAKAQGPLGFLGPRRTEGYIVYWFLFALAVLILLPELVQLARSTVRPLAQGIARSANRQAAKLRGVSDARPWAWLLARSSLCLLMLVRSMWIYCVRFVTLPVRTYYHPTVTAVLSTALVHWFLVAGVVFVLEAESEEVRDRLDGGPLARDGLIYTLWRMAVFFTNQSLDDVPLSLEGKVAALAGLVVFLLMMTAYAASFREERERRIHRRLRNKPRFLPMQDHALVVGDLFSVRLILQQLQHYGRNQDIVVAGLDPATATVAGLDRLEPLVWAVEGNLQEREVRRQAKVERAAELVVAAANLKRGEAWRTVAAVEGDRPSVTTVVDAREEDDRVIEKVLTQRPGDPVDLNLRWERRRVRFRATCREIPGFAELIRDLVSFHPRSEFPRWFNLTRHPLLCRPRRWKRLGRFRSRVLLFYTRCFNVVPLWPGPVHDEVGHLHRLCASGEQVYLMPVHWQPGAWRWLLRLFRRPLQPTVAEEPPPPVNGQPWRASAAEFVSAVGPAERRLPAEPDAETEPPPAEERSAAYGEADDPAEVETDDPADDSAAASAKKASAVFSRTRLEEDRRLLDELVKDSVWKNSSNGRRRLVEFNYPESAAALSTICERNRGDGRVEAYSDLEMRSLWLSILAICGESALELLDALWPANGSEEPRLRFEIAWVDADFLGDRDSIGFGRALRRCLGSAMSLLAYRSPGGKWIPCAYGRRLQRGDQLLRLRRTDLDPLGGASGAP